MILEIDFMLFRSWLSFFCQRPQRPHRRKLRRKRYSHSSAIQQLEVRTLLSAYTVTNLNDSGNGSLRQAIQNANAHAGADVINFSVAGVITLTSGALSTIMGQVDLHGDSAPGFAGSPVVEVNFNGFAGLQFSAGASGSAVRSLALDNASGAGVTINGGTSDHIVGNYIGLGLDGTTVAANGGNGIELHGTISSDIALNVISGNGGNGIALYGAAYNTIETNSIGTDVTGTLGRGNAQNGILITTNSVGNLIGGTATGGNDPTGGVFVRPPQGNLISGNHADGVLITGGSTLNVLSGNFIGTDITGDAAIGNTLDGVAIVNANRNSLIGCIHSSNPFIYYNVIDGNGGNGLRINNSNLTTIQANFFGLGADNQTALGNALNGIVVEGTSAGTQLGGQIPLGNVVAANGLNGIVVKDTASGFLSFNTFCGLAAFKTYTNLGNHADGMLITSTGGNIVIRTNVITENGNDGIEISGYARDVHVGFNIIGLDTNGQAAMGNVNNGVEVDGHAHDIVIGGPKQIFSIIPYNIISGNGANGVAVTGNAHDVSINYSDIGTNVTGLVALGNVNAGIYLGAGTYGTTIGSTNSSLRTVISGNGGDGIQMVGTTGNTVIDTLIGVNFHNTGALSNGGNGISLSNSSNNMIGGSAATANTIAFNGINGVLVSSGNSNGILANSIYGNTSLGIDLASGANQNQAAPVLTSVVLHPQVIQVSGTLTSTPLTTFKVDLFASSTSGSSGRVYLGRVLAHTNAAGNATFTFAGLRPGAGLSFITATATDLNNNTSEFSAPIS